MDLKTLSQHFFQNVEEAARRLGVGATKLKKAARTRIGLQRWPQRHICGILKSLEEMRASLSIFRPSILTEERAG